jgi:WD40 repeat protein
LYEHYISHISDSHKTHISSMKWFPKNYNFTKSKQLANNDSGQSYLLATLGEDGQVLIWDLKPNEISSRLDSTPYNMKPVVKVEVNIMDC